MYYRRKILLALLYKLGGKVTKLSFQKLLFLFSKAQQNAAYSFVPYKFGCYSFQASADMTTLGKYGFVNETEKSYHLNNLPFEDDFYLQLTPEDQKLINGIVKNYGKLSTSALIKHIYRKYPYYAINSTIAEEHLSTKEFENVIRSRPYSNETILFTIGYEGINVEEYFNKLIQNDVKVLIDVRNFSRSMKFGFSKNQLKKICEGTGIVYIHLPRLGIESDYRKNLKKQEDYLSYLSFTNQPRFKPTEQINKPSSTW